MKFLYFWDFIEYAYSQAISPKFCEFDGIKSAVNQLNTYKFLNENSINFMYNKGLL